MKNLKQIIQLFCFLGILTYSNVMANEEANYEIIDKNDIYEIRKYSDRLAVETMTLGIDNNFRKLFNYISGRNDTEEKIKMTTPVTQVEKNGNMSMQFYLPSKFDKNNVNKHLLQYNLLECIIHNLPTISSLCFYVSSSLNQKSNYFSLSIPCSYIQSCPS